ncbi:hypothetical protein [Escherichia phage vB_EcoM_JNE01]|nr:hypothetical protein [Escherichia phage vB_EcoM_JNE01]
MNKEQLFQYYKSTLSKGLQESIAVESAILQNLNAVEFTNRITRHAQNALQGHETLRYYHIIVLCMEV